MQHLVWKPKILGLRLWKTSFFFWVLNQFSGRLHCLYWLLSFSGLLAYIYVYLSVQIKRPLCPLARSFAEKVPKCFHVGDLREREKERQREGKRVTGREKERECQWEGERELCSVAVPFWRKAIIKQHFAAAVWTDDRHLCHRYLVRNSRVPPPHPTSEPVRVINVGRPGSAWRPRAFLVST